MNYKVWKIFLAKTKSSRVRCVLWMSLGPASFLSHLKYCPFLMLTVGGMEGGECGHKRWSRITMVTANLYNPFVPLSTFNSFLLSVALHPFVWLFSPCSVGAMSVAHQALPMIYAMTRCCWRIAALLPDVSRKTNGNSGSYRTGFGCCGVWRGGELSFRVDGYDAGLGGCVCGWGVAAGAKNRG